MPLFLNWPTKASLTSRKKLDEAIISYLCQFLVVSNICLGPEQNRQVLLPWFDCSIHKCLWKWHSWNFGTLSQGDTPYGKHKKAFSFVWRCVPVTSCQTEKLLGFVCYTALPPLYKTLATFQAQLPRKILFWQKPSQLTPWHDSP